jgi:hypothetical protein
MLVRQMFMSLIPIILLYFVYLYLRNLNNCECVNQEYVLRLKNIITIFISLSVLSLIINLLSPSIIISYINNIDTITRYLYLFALIPLLIIIGYIYIYAYFIYDVYMFSKTMQVPCPCAEAWQKWYLYLEAFTSGLLLLSIFGISGFFILAKDFRKGFFNGLSLQGKNK